MSVLFVVVPAVAAGWPVLCGAVAVAAGSLGYRVLRETEDGCAVAEAGPITREVTLDGGEVLSESMTQTDAMTIENGGVRAVFQRTQDGRCTVHVSGADRTEEELSAIGRELVGRVTQQYAYNRVVTELKSQGFTITDEAVTAEQTIRVRVSRYV